MAINSTVIKHSTTYILCSKLIERGNTEGLAEKIDVFLLANRVTQKEYEELIAKITPPKPTV